MPAKHHAQVCSAVYNYLTKRGERSHPLVRNFTFDLNGDGCPDAIVLLTGNKWCGSGGRNMLVFQGTKTGFTFVSASTVTQEPVAVLPETRHGWHTLVVRSGRVGNI